MHTPKPLWIVLALALALICAGPIGADEVTDAINEALEYYKDGAFTDAAGSLEYAAQLIRQQKGNQLIEFLPKPLAGWRAEESQSQAMGTAMFGGGVTAEREYLKGSSRVSVQIVTDSPMMQGMMMMFTNPAFATADGGKLTKVNRQKAIAKYSAADKNGQIQLLIANRFLVTIEGDDVAEADIRAYAEAIDYKKLAQMQ